MQNLILLEKPDLGLTQDLGRSQDRVYRDRYPHLGQNRGQGPRVGLGLGRRRRIPIPVMKLD